MFKLGLGRLCLIHLFCFEDKRVNLKLKNMTKEQIHLTAKIFIFSFSLKWFFLSFRNRWNKTFMTCNLRFGVSLRKDLGSEAVYLVRCLGHSQLISSLSPLVNKLLGGILSWAQTLIRSFTERQLSHKVHPYLVHNLCLTHSQGTKSAKMKFMPISFTTRV